MTDSRLIDDEDAQHWNIESERKLSSRNLGINSYTRLANSTKFFFVNDEAIPRNHDIKNLIKLAKHGFAMSDTLADLSFFKEQIILDFLNKSAVVI